MKLCRLFMNYLFLKWCPILPSVHTKLPLLQSWVILLEWIQKSQQSLHKRNLRLVPVYIKYAICTSCPEECRAAAHSRSTHSPAFVVEYFPTAWLVHSRTAAKLRTVTKCAQYFTWIQKQLEPRSTLTWVKRMIILYFEKVTGVNQANLDHIVISNNANLKSI